MKNTKTMVTTIIIIGGLVTAFLSVYDPSSDALDIVVKDGHTYVDGVMAPDLSDLPFHGAYIDDNTCLSCHLEDRELNIMGQTYLSKKMAHEKRDSCNRCHTLTHE